MIPTVDGCHVQMVAALTERLAGVEVEKQALQARLKETEALALFQASVLDAQSKTAQSSSKVCLCPEFA